MLFALVASRIARNGNKKKKERHGQPLYTALGLSMLNVAYYLLRFVVCNVFFVTVAVSGEILRLIYVTIVRFPIYRNELFPFLLLFLSARRGPLRNVGAIYAS